MLPSLQQIGTNIWSSFGTPYNMCMYTFWIFELQTNAPKTCLGKKGTKNYVKLGVGWGGTVTLCNAMPVAKHKIWISLKYFNFLLRGQSTCRPLLINQNNILLVKQSSLVKVSFLFLLLLWSCIKSWEWWLEAQMNQPCIKRKRRKK